MRLGESKRLPYCRNCRTWSDLSVATDKSKFDHEMDIYLGKTGIIRQAGDHDMEQDRRNTWEEGIP